MRQPDDSDPGALGRNKQEAGGNLFQGPRPGVSRPKACETGAMGRAVLDLGNRYEKERVGLEKGNVSVSKMQSLIGGFPLVSIRGEGLSHLSVCLSPRDVRRLEQEYAAL